ncbi:MAG: hypothetical protein EBX39_03155 [Actinobacteria bacterium]|nr:hypothetical protein [Actinomycetota bacterium]
MDLVTTPSERSTGRMALVSLAVVAAAALVALVVAMRRVGPEATFEPGLEFNPDFDLTVDEIIADIRGDSPHG